ncbi:MAG: hypothetical protein BWX59_00173 [Bacteroidetes bacterium ADurb.Bin028]|nr:MAG: hypothetical protein BWX59_00173 [Bacteroidetes bacterium ADurb.Bin028]
MLKNFVCLGGNSVIKRCINAVDNGTNCEDVTYIVHKNI